VQQEICLLIYFPPDKTYWLICYLYWLLFHAHDWHHKETFLFLMCRSQTT